MVWNIESCVYHRVVFRDVGRIFIAIGKASMHRVDTTMIYFLKENTVYIVT